MKRFSLSFYAANGCCKPIESGDYACVSSLLSLEASTAFGVVFSG